MRVISLNDVNELTDFFHFDIRKISYIESNGFPANKGPDSQRAEDTKKVFFSKGYKGILDLMDVWIIWRMNRDNEKKSGWVEEFLSEEYLKDEVKKEETFANIYEWLSQRKYYKIDLIEGKDYDKNDIDEAKKRALDQRERLKGTDEKPWNFLYTYQFYKDKIEHFDATMEDWNMHTFTDVGVDPDKISLVETSSGKNDALSVLEEVYNRYQNKSNFRVLDSFIRYCSTRKKLEETSNNISKKDQVDLMIDAMVNGTMDVNGQTINNVDNNTIIKTKTMGFSVSMLIGLITLICVVIIIITIIMM